MAITLDGSNGILSPDFEPSSSTLPTNGLYLPSANTLGLATNGTGKAFLDSAGNFGLGVTPSAWSSTYKAIQVGAGGSFSTGASVITYSAIGANYFDNGASRYIGTGAATLYAQNAGQHIWYTAPSGTAGNAISFTQAMTLDASGNLGIGTSSPVVKLDVVGTIKLAPSVGTSPTIIATSTGTGSANFTFANADTTVAFNSPAIINLYNTNSTTNTFTAIDGFDASGNVITRIASIATDQTNHAGALAFVTRNGGSYGERARIDSSGNLLVGTTTISDASQAALCVYAAFPKTVVELRQSGTSTHYAITFRNGNGLVGNISTSGSTTAYNTSSDQRLKENIVDAPSALSSVNAIKVRSFDWKSDGSHVDYGYIAQELLAVVPEAVSIPADPEDMMGVDFGKLTPRLVKAIQELTARLEALEAK